jgi:hypothetical protein
MNPRQHTFTGEERDDAMSGHYVESRSVERVAALDSPAPQVFDGSGTEPDHEPENGTIAFSTTQMHEYRHLFWDMCRQFGMQDAIDRWLDDILDDWLAWIKIGKQPQPVNREDAAWFAHLAVGINEVLSMRDALILTLFVDVQPFVVEESAERISVGAVRQLASKPHHRVQTRLMARQLDRAFYHEQSLKSVSRCRNGVSTLSMMCAMVPQEYRVQALAMIAYINWWLGDVSAQTYAEQALALDDECSLASIVLCALEHNIRPTVVGKR